MFPRQILQIQYNRINILFLDRIPDAPTTTWKYGQMEWIQIQAVFRNFAEIMIMKIHLYSYPKERKCWLSLTQIVSFATKDFNADFGLFNLMASPSLTAL